MNETEQLISQQTEEDSEEFRGVDKELYEKCMRVKEIIFLQDFEHVTPGNQVEEKKRFFENNGSQNPEFTYPKIDLNELNSKEEKLLLLKEEMEVKSDIKPSERSEKVEQMDKSELVKQSYRWRINQKIAQIRMLKASAEGKMSAFGKYSRFIYGDPSPVIYQSIIKDVNKKADELGDKTAAEKWNSITPQLLGQTDFPKIRPAQEQIDETMEELPSFEHLMNVEGDLSRTVEAEEIVDAFNYAIGELKAEGWLAVINDEEGKNQISVNHIKQTVEVPRKRKVLASYLKQLVAHEIGTHINRRVNGERSSLKLLNFGLDRYYKGEEGVAKLSETKVKGEEKGYSQYAIYLAISLASGVDGKRRDFKEVFPIIREYYELIKQAKTDPSLDLETSDELAWKTCVRVFRGTDCSSDACFTKDLIYLEGNIGVWDVIERDKDEMSRFYIGRYDPANQRHIAIMNRLGVSDKDFDDLNDEPEESH